ncbi:MAG: serine/threonine protein kinase [Nitrospirae bacterium]|nr:serine/threonine protein kinase [Nitrospirota bacterium]
MSALPSDAPHQIGRYEVLERIGLGGMAEVYKARLVTSDGAEKTVALKKILPQWAEDPQLRAMFLQEVKLAFALSHRNIVSVFDHGEWDGSYYLVMDYVEGQDLGQVLRALARRGERLPESLCVYVAHEVLAALEYAHEKRDAEGHLLNIVHRDVSPSNIYLSYEGEVKLGDFGIAKVAIHPQTSVPALKGKWSYMSPEQARGETIDARADLYALGLTLYEMLTGLNPLADENDFLVLERAKNAAIPDPLEASPKMAPALAETLRRLLKPLPAERFQTAGEIGEQLQRLLFEHGSQRWERKLGRFLKGLFPPETRTVAPRTTADSERRPTKVMPQGGPTASKGRRWVWAAGAVGAGLIATAVVALTRSGRPEPVAPVHHPPEAAASAPADEMPAPAPPTAAAGPPNAVTETPQPAEPPPAPAPRPTPDAFGYLNLNSTPWAHVIVDGRPLDGTTPLMKLKLSAGHHVVELTNPYMTRKRKIELDVRPGQTHNLVIDLSEEP